MKYYSESQVVICNWIYSLGVSMYVNILLAFQDHYPYMADNVIIVNGKFTGIFRNALFFFMV